MQFINFLESLRTSNNSRLLEAIEAGYVVCFENFYNQDFPYMEDIAKDQIRAIYIDPYSGKYKVAVKENTNNIHKVFEVNPKSYIGAFGLHSPDEKPLSLKMVHARDLPALGERVEFDDLPDNVRDVMTHVISSRVKNLRYRIKALKKEEAFA